MVFNYLLQIPILVSFIITLLVLPNWIKKSKDIGLVWDDMNKFDKRKVAGSGGTIVILGFIAGLFTYVAYRTFIVESSDFIIQTLAILVVILILSGVAFIDDLIGWKKGGLTISGRILLVAFAAVPLVVINAGKSQISLPLIGLVDLGIIYPLFFIPLGIVGATTTFNMLAGFNGLEAGQGIIILSGLSLVTYLTGNSWLSIISLCMISSLLAFLFYNFNPAKVLSGDSMTYAVGGLIACMAILGNIEKIAVFFFTPYILEVFLKSRGGLKKHSFGKPTENGELNLLYDKIYSLNHLAILLMNKLKIKSTEKKAVYLIWMFQLVIILLGLFIFRTSLF